MPNQGKFCELVIKYLQEEHEIEAMKLSPRFTEALDQRTFVEDLSRVKNTGIGSYLDEKYSMVDYDSAWYQGDQIVFVESENMLTADGPWTELHPLFNQTVYVNTSSHIAPVTA